MLILEPGFEKEVRSKLGVSDDDITDEELNSPFVLDIAEAKIIKLVPNYVNIVNTSEKLFLKLAVINQIGADMCNSMVNRVNTEVSTLDVKWKKGKTDWDKLQATLLGEVMEALSNITSVEIVLPVNPPIMGKISNTRKPIGELLS
jgi:hypothetical protein